MFAWGQACMEATVLGSFLNDLRSASSQGQALDIWDFYWQKDGFDGLVWSFSLLEFGLGAINGVLCLAPWRSMACPSHSVCQLMFFCLKSFARHPVHMSLLGLSGLLLAQASLAFAPFALLSCWWFVACAFAARDLGAADPST